MELSERKLQILQTIIDEYLGTAEPVGSRAISKKNPLGLSSATIRNEMADLEEMGFLIQPHTSAGRVPSDAAYRFYVNSMMQKYKIGIETIEKLQTALEEKVNQLDLVIKKANLITSSITDYTAFVTSPNFKSNQIKKCELISLGGGSSLLIIITATGDVRNKILTLPLTEESARNLSEIVNKTLCGLCACDITFEKIQSMQTEIEAKLKLTPKALINILDFIYEAIEELDNTEIYIENAKSILKYNNIENAQKMFTFLDDKKNLRHLIEDSNNEKVNVKIGSEIDAEELKNCSLVTVNYSINNKPAGKLGVIGPKRMDYAKVIASLDYISSEIDRILYQMYGEREE